MRLVVIGCTGSCSGPEAPASCYLVQSTDESGRCWTIALDFGSGAFGPLLGLMAPENLDLVALSHLHADHCSDLAGLRVYSKYRLGSALRNLPVYGPTGTAQMLESLQLGSGPRRPEFDARQWQAVQAVQVGPMSLMPYRVNHPVEAWGFRITGPSEVGQGQRTLAYSGDTDQGPGLTALAAEADLLLIEAGFTEESAAVKGVHLTGQRAGLVASQAGAKRVVVTHIPPWHDPAATVAEVARAFSGPVHLARPNLTIVL
ncbi:MAG: MBL fold metallo-hydrolase [Micrococcales bacterium]|nr:MBL fold metallo-hydrolase [Micrococcales bacterium]